MMARLLRVAPRTVRRWKADATGPRARLGRPPLTADPDDLRAIARAWRTQGKSVGWRPVWHALEHLSRLLVQRVVAELKRRRRVRTARADARRRQSIRVAGRDVLWSLDATHLGRDRGGKEVQGQAVREVSSLRTLALTVGDVVDTEDAIAVVTRAAHERAGKYPLVLVTDNGSPYVSEDFESFLHEHGVTHLLSLPHTPRHNPWVERGHLDLKEESGLGKGVIVQSHADAARRLAAALERVDGHRLRATLDYRTARAVDAELAVPYHDGVRDRLARMVALRVEDGLHDHETKRARRMLRREAVLASLEELELIERTRGGLPLRAVKEDTVS
jgi:transposase InsO family protein